MPTYRVTDSVTGKTLKLTGDSAPTEQELVDIFKSYTPNKKRDFITPAKQTAETVAALVTGGTSWIPAGLSMGLPTIEKHGISFIPRSMEELEKRSERALKIQEKLTYQPKDKAAQRAVEIIAKPITYLPEKGKEKAEHFRKLGDEAYENGDIKTAKMYWALGGVTEFAGEASPFLIPAGVGKGVKGIKTKVNKFKAQFEEPLGLTKRTAVEQVPEAKTSAVIPEETKTKSPELKTQEKVTESKLSQEPSGVESEVDKTKEIKPSTPEDPLITEARKYKTAEEFVNSQLYYHGTNKSFKEFKHTTNAELGRGYYFTPDMFAAQKFAWGKKVNQGGKQNIITVTPTFKKPLVLGEGVDGKLALELWEKSSARNPNGGAIEKIAKDGGYDAVIRKGYGEGEEIMVFDKKNIKIHSQSATPEEVLSKTADIKADLTSIWNKAQEKTAPKTPEADLIAEARKYKTAEEFIEAQGKIVYHGTPSKELNFGEQPIGNQLPFGVHFQEHIPVAKRFADGTTKVKPTGNEGTIYESIMPKNPLNIDKGLFYEGTKEFAILKEIAEKSKIKDSKYIIEYKGKVAIDPMSIFWKRGQQAKLDVIKDVLTKNGYDQAIVYGMKGTVDPLGVGAPHYTPAVAILDKSLIKTKSELTDIWNKAQEGGSGTPKGGTPETPKSPQTKPAKAALDINKKLAEKGLEQLPPEELAQYPTIKQNDIVQKVVDALTTDEKAIIDASLGKRPFPEDVHPQVAFNTVEKLANSRGDIDLLLALEKSPVATQRSLMAQGLGASAWNKLRGSFVEKLKTIRREREKQIKADPEKVTKAKRQIHEETKKVLLNVEELSWNKFLKDIVC